MAEYIEFHCPHGDDFEGGDECDRCEKYELCMETPKADVVERSEYIKSQREVLRLMDLSHQVGQDAMKYEGMCMELRSKIDKAIEEIKQEIQNGTIQITSGNEKLFNILKKIGE